MFRMHIGLARGEKISPGQTLMLFEQGWQRAGCIAFCDRMLKPDVALQVLPESYARNKDLMAIRLDKPSRRTWICLIMFA